MKMFFSGLWAANGATNFGIAVYDSHHHSASEISLGSGVFCAWLSMAYLAAWLKNG